MNREDREKNLEKFNLMLQEVESRVAKERLSDYDLALLCYSKILHTYTFNEKDYK